MDDLKKQIEEMTAYPDPVVAERFKALRARLEAVERDRNEWRDLAVSYLTQKSEAKVRAERAEAALQLVKRMIDEALPKFNWGASFLDANAITLLNKAPIAVNQALALIEKEPKT